MFDSTTHEQLGIFLWVDEAGMFLLGRKGFERMVGRCWDGRDTRWGLKWAWVVAYADVCWCWMTFGWRFQRMVGGLWRMMRRLLETLAGLICNIGLGEMLYQGVQQNLDIRAFDVTVWLLGCDYKLRSLLLPCD